MTAEVWSYPDPFDGLKLQLAELRGLVKVVPPLIEADRRRRWEEIGSRPGDPEADMIDLYESEAGPEEGWGHATYDRTLYATAVVNAWELFHAYLARLLYLKALKFNLRDYPVLEKIVLEEERRSWDRRFEQLKVRYKDFLGIQLTQLPGWEAIVHAHELRNALVHNLGHYTERYAKLKMACLPTRDDLLGRRPPPRQEPVDRELIPLSESFSQQVIDDLLDAAEQIDDAVEQA